LRGVGEKGQAGFRRNLNQFSSRATFWPRAPVLLSFSSATQPPKLVLFHFLPLLPLMHGREGSRSASSFILSFLLYRVCSFRLSNINLRYNYLGLNFSSGRGHSPLSSLLVFDPNIRVARRFPVQSFLLNMSFSRATSIIFQTILSSSSLPKSIGKRRPTSWVHYAVRSLQFRWVRSWSPCDRYYDFYNFPPIFSHAPAGILPVIMITSLCLPWLCFSL